VRYSPFVLLLLLLPGAFAVGFVPPAQREFIFQPNGEFSVPIIVANGQEIYVSLQYPYGNGDPGTLGTPNDNNIGEYVHIDDPAPGTKMREINVVFDLPGQMAPGIYPVDILIADQPGGSSGTVRTVAAAKIRLTLRVLSDEKLVEIIGFRAHPTAEGLRANATVDVISRTTQTIDRLSARFEVRDNGTAVASGLSPGVTLASGKEKRLLGVMNTEGLIGGDYDVFVTVTYDGLTTDGGPTTLQIGTLHVTATNHSKTFIYNATNKFTFTLENEWNRALKNVYAVASINGQEKQTASLDIPPFGSTNYELYFDRDAGLEPGPHLVDLDVTFQDYDPKSGTYVNERESFALPIEVSLPVVVERPILLNPVLWLLLLALIIAVLVLYFATRRRGDVQ